MKHERVDYNTIRDEFSIFEVENGQILKAKLSLVDVYNIKKDTGPEAQLNTQPYSFVITPSEIDTTGFEIASGPITEQDQIKELKFNPIKEVINIYETKKAFIFLGLKMQKIFLTSKLNQKKEPILRYVASHGVDVVEKPDFSGKPKEIK